ncbi:PB1 domain-containing protein [Heracleum sosnowskyi]|uniref:PB1 domain-containing protein n=1 Tax=Heracleum sosnowskyi TaxID=360622 RepID=A0AAD8ILU5_9APIA|nr:PB1 domain-containing protein [Heracleum sosnowskyi]
MALPNESSNLSLPCNNDTWEDPTHAIPGAKLRVMCSYGGHIIPRPHDKCLCYVGGETRMVVMDRLSSLSDLSSRLSSTLLHGRHFHLKYQLPNEELDSLVSISNDDDLENMIDEYDRITSVSSLKSSRIRLFLFLAKPETAASMGCLLNDAKSETWFVDALNGAGLIPRVLSDSAANMENLLGFHDQVINNHCIENISYPEHTVGDGKQGENVRMLESPVVLETYSSFGSSSSSPSMSNLPHIRVRSDNDGLTLQDQMAGLDEQFSQMNTNVATTMQNQGDGIVMVSAALPPLPVVISTTISSENGSRFVSDDEKSDQGAPTRFRKPPLPLQPVQRKLDHDTYNLPSPDSVASDNSITSASSLSRRSQDPTQVATRKATRPAANGIVSPNSITSDPNSQIQVQQVPAYLQPGTHYLQHTATGQVQVPSYYPVYAAPGQPQYHQQVDQQYSMYVMPVQQVQPYNMAIQQNVTDSNVTPDLNYPQNPSIVTHSATKPTLVQVQPNQYQQQYINASQMPYSSQSPAPVVNYGYKYAQPTQVYYKLNPASQLPPPPQYQTMTSATAMFLSQASVQESADNVK